MKIGIMTFWWTKDNYGQILQCYALQKYLNNNGHDAFLIRYNPHVDDRKQRFFLRIQHAMNPCRLMRRILNTMDKKYAQRKFQDFRDRYITSTEKVYNSYAELVLDPPDADVYITGSDQVWNFLPREKGHSGRFNAFLLNFGNDHIKRMSYAASFGKENIDSELGQKMSRVLINFTYISVREKSGLDICRRHGITKAELVPDPTFLVDAHTYRSLYRDASEIKVLKPYCFLYLLTNETGIDVSVIYNWAAAKGLDVIYVPSGARQDLSKRTYAAIPEWLFLIDNAKYVFTNSYHGSVFSLLFHKKFGIIKRVGSGEKMNTRFSSLFEQFSLEPRYINSDINTIDKEIDWTMADTKIRALCASISLLNYVQ
jgi:hypothetical protein